MEKARLPRSELHGTRTVSSSTLPARRIFSGSVSPDFAASMHDAVTALDSGRPCRRSASHGFHEGAGRLRHVENFRDLTGDDLAFDSGPECLVLEQQPASRVRRDHEPEPFAAAGLRDVVAHDADYLAAEVEGRTSGRRSSLD